MINFNIKQWNYKIILTLLAGAIEYTNYSSAEG